jgi:hypothetical protein
MNFNSYRTLRKTPLFNHHSKYTACLLLIAIMIFVGSVVTAFNSDEEELTNSETRKIAPPTPIVTAEAEEINNSYFDVPLDADIQDYILVMCAECDTCDLDPAIITAMIWKESEFDTNAIGDNGNSLGLMQVQPRWHSERMEKLNATDLLDPYQNIRVGIDYLVELYSINDDIQWVLMAYNGGPTYANNLRSSGLVSDYALEVLDKAEELKSNSRI